MEQGRRGTGRSHRLDTEPGQRGPVGRGRLQGGGEQRGRPSGVGVDHRDGGAAGKHRVAARRRECGAGRDVYIERGGGGDGADQLPVAQGRPSGGGGEQEQPELGQRGGDRQRRLPRGGVEPRRDRDE